MTADLMLLLSNNGLTALTEWRDLAVSGGLLFDLLEADRITISSDVVAIKNDQPTGFAALDAALDQLRFLGPTTPDNAAETLRFCISQQGANQMAQEEVARPHQLSKRTIVWQVMRPEERAALCDRLAAVITARTTADDRLRSIIAVIRGVRVEDHVLRGSVRDIHMVAGHLIHERQWPGVIISEALELAKISVVRKDYERKIREAYARGRAAG